MRKWLFLFFFLCLFFFCHPKDETTMVTFNENKTQSNIFCLDVSKLSFTTRKLVLLSNQKVKILRVYPLNQLSFSDTRIKNRLSSFAYRSIDQVEEDYQNQLQHLGLFDEIEKTKQFGVLLKKIKVSGNIEEIEKAKIKKDFILDQKNCNSSIEFD